MVTVVNTLPNSYMPRWDSLGSNNRAMSTAFSNFCVLATAGYTGRESLETQPEKLEAFTAAVGDEGSPNDAMQVVLENTPRVSARAKEAWALHVNEAYAFMSNPDNTVNPK